MNMQQINKFYNTKSINKVFNFEGNTFVERVAKYPKIVYTNDLLKDKIVSSKSIYPEDKKNLFSLRIDVDEIDSEEFAKYLEIFKPFSRWVTIFCCASIFSDKVYLLNNAKNIGIDIQSHGYYHHTYRDYENNYHNILKAKEFFEKNRISTFGFAAPMGRYNHNLMLALEDLGYRYSSDFSFDYLNLPHYPKLGARFSKILQIPIFPICPELLCVHGFHLDKIIAYYDYVIRVLEQSNIPIIIYAHTDRRYPEVKEFLKQLLEKIKDNDKLYKCNISDFASRCFSYEDKTISRQYGIINSQLTCNVSHVPDQSLLGVPDKASLPEKIKKNIKETIDFENITPANELKGNVVKKALKILVRKFFVTK